MPNSSWGKMRPWVVQTLLLVVIILTAWFGIRFLLSTVRDKMGDIQKLSVIREHREKQLERLPELELQHALIVENRESLDIILTKARLVEFIETLESLAIAGNVAIEIVSRDNAFLESKVTPLEKKEEGAKSSTASAGRDDGTTEPVKRSGTNKETGIVTELPLKKYLKLTITITGKYSDIIQYLHQLETLPYALDVIGMNIKEQPSEDDPLDSQSGVLNPFDEVTEIRPVASKTNMLNAVFDMVVYMKD